MIWWRVWKGGASGCSPPSAGRLTRFASWSPRSSEGWRENRLHACVEMHWNAAAHFCRSVVLRPAQFTQRIHEVLGTREGVRRGGSNQTPTKTSLDEQTALSHRERVDKQGFSWCLEPQRYLVPRKQPRDASTIRASLTVLPTTSGLGPGNTAWDDETQAGLPIPSKRSPRLFSQGRAMVIPTRFLRFRSSANAFSKADWLHGHRIPALRTTSTPDDEVNNSGGPQPTLRRCETVRLEENGATGRVN
ncbi:hypothetical protein F4780DRAFT_374525 [Xylariomycetidae sp. FL0641]|nr:hypothetical protein F4780DRAFT_374525 [Xylariomycetidae sp. FL0641]